MSNLVPRNNHFQVRNQLFHPFEATFNKFFDDFFNNRSLLDTVKGSAGYPKLDVSLDGDYWVIRAAVPGVELGDLKVELTDDEGDLRANGKILRISGRMSEDNYSANDSEYYVRELKRGSFVREIRLPEGVSGEPDASLKDGVLTLRWPWQGFKKEKTKLVNVKSG